MVCELISLRFPLLFIAPSLPSVFFSKLPISMPSMAWSVLNMKSADMIARQDNSETLALDHIESPPPQDVVLYHIESPPPSLFVLYHLESPGF